MRKGLVVSCMALATLLAAGCTESPRAGGDGGGDAASAGNPDGGGDGPRRDDGASNADAPSSDDRGAPLPPDGTVASGDGASRKDGAARRDGARPADGALRRDGGTKADAAAPTADLGVGRDTSTPPTGDAAPPVAACLATLPPMAESAPPTPADVCDSMDWNLSMDGFYLVSQFGTSADSTTWGRGTSCGGLLTHYMNWCCMYDRHQQKCLDGQTPQFLKCHSWVDPHVPKIPWVKGTVDYNYWTVVNRVGAYFFDSKGNPKPVADTMAFNYPEYFYVAGAQRFNCGTTLRVTNTENGRCVVVYVEDGGPGATYEQAGYGGRRIIDASPALHRYLKTTKSGWKNSTLLYAEWGLPTDKPGQPCTPCAGTAAKRGTESQRTPYDINHDEGARGGLGCR